jgi:fatty-acyl-CoA synthase
MHTGDLAVMREDGYCNVVGRIKDMVIRGGENIYPPGRAPLDADAVRAFATGKLAHYKIPRYVHVVDEFPMTITGKVRKIDMREESVRLLGL